jgi:hypothetical protein
VSEDKLLVNQGDLVEAARAAAGFSSDMQMAGALGIHPARLSEIKKGILPADPYEIFRLAEMANIPPIEAAAASRHKRERNPRKRAYWQKIMQQGGDFPDSESGAA